MIFFFGRLCMETWIELPLTDKELGQRLGWIHFGNRIRMFGGFKCVWCSILPGMMIWWPLMTPQQWPLFFGMFERQSDPVRFLCGNFSKISAMAFYTFKHRISCSWIRGDSVPGLHFLLVRTRNPSICWKNIAINNTTVEKNKPQMICQWSYVVITHGMLEIPEIPPFCPMNFPFKWPWKWWIFQPCLMTQHDAWTGLDCRWTIPTGWFLSHG